MTSLNMMQHIEASDMERERRLVGCRDACGNQFDPAKLPPGQACPSDWSYLSLTKGFRCPDCWRALDAVKGITGPPGSTPDNLEKDSLGALPDLKGRVPHPVSTKG